MTGSLEASGAGYARQETTWTPGTAGRNDGTTEDFVLTPVAAGYTEGGLWSSSTAGTFIGSAPFNAGTVYISGTSATVSVTPAIREYPVFRVVTDHEVEAVGQNRMRILDGDGTPVVIARRTSTAWVIVAAGVSNVTAQTRRGAIGDMMTQALASLGGTGFSTLVPYGIADLP